MNAWALTRLMRSCRLRADAVEAVLFASLESPTRESYRHFLCDVYGFVAAFEPKFAFTQQLDLAFIQARIKSGRLSNDLLALGLTAAEYERLATRCAVPDFTNVLDVLGWLFVIERLVVRSSALRYRLERAIPREIEIAGSFIRTYGDELETRLTQLDRMIDHWITNEGDHAQLATATTAAYDALEAWLRAGPSTTVLVEAKSA